MSRPKVLYGEANEEVMALGAAMLHASGYSVQTAIGRQGVQDALKQATFDIVILGPTLNRDDRHHLPFMVKKSSANTQVAVMHTDGSRHHYVDINTDSGSGMEELLKKLGRPQPVKIVAAAASSK
jgi:DNA-binding NtrC family response regulator